MLTHAEVAALLKSERKPRCCAVCGKPMGGRYVGMRRYHKGKCARFVFRERDRVYRQGRLWRIEDQPWFKGAAAPVAQPEPEVASEPRILPTDWLDGWARVHGWASA